VYQEKLGIDGQAAVYLDVTHIRAKRWTGNSKGFWKSTRNSWASIRVEPMKVFPAMHYTMGGIWVNGGRSGQATFPEFTRRANVNTSITGPNRLGANRWCRAFLAEDLRAQRR